MVLLFLVKERSGGPLRAGNLGKIRKDYLSLFGLLGVPLALLWALVGFKRQGKVVAFSCLILGQIGFILTAMPGAWPLDYL